jgi:uncharacterized protein involved in response to NO
MPVFFSYAFRPFFLFAFVYAFVAMSAWLTWIGLHAIGAQVLEMSISLPPFQWHAHEMLFGYSIAVITGFFLTAVPNWTDTRPVQGPTLVALASAWVVGRLAIWFSAYLPDLLVAGLDLLLIPMLLGLVLKALKSRWSKRNFIFVPILLTLFAGNLLVHLEQLGITEDTMSMGHTLALNVVLILIAIIGGRVIPAFTTNALRRLGEEELPQPYALFDVLSVVSIILIAIGDLLGLDDTLRGSLAVFAVVVNTLRMTKWQTAKTFNQPIVWIIHLGYAWLIIGMALKATALFGASLSEITAMHALTVGTVGSMTVGIMTRAALGHTGRLIHASPMIVAAYVMISLAALVRIIGPSMLPELYNEAMLLSGLLWVVLFAGLSWVFWPVLTRPRINT